MDKNLPCRRFRIKNTRGFQVKRKAIRCSARETIAAIKREIERGQNYCDAFLDFCLLKAQTIQKNIDPDGLGQGAAIYGCKFCDKIFSKSTALGGHISKVHKQMARSLEMGMNNGDMKDGDDGCQGQKVMNGFISPNKGKIGKLPKTAFKQNKRKRMLKRYGRCDGDEEYMEQ